MSEQIKPVPYDKKNWSKGEWDNEEDRVDFIHAGFSCFILRNMNGNWCGYVGIPKEHAAYEMDMNDIPVEVHGGITYKETCNGHICHIPQEGMPEDVMWIGFDTAHVGDMSPSLKINIFPDAIYRNQEYAINETKSLAEQLSEIKK